MRRRISLDRPTARASPGHKRLNARRSSRRLLPRHWPICGQLGPRRALPETRVAGALHHPGELSCLGITKPALHQSGVIAVTSVSSIISGKASAVTPINVWTGSGAVPKFLPRHWP
jgi:hypothetical protein